MMTIGLRASPTEVTFAVYDSDTKRIVNIEEVVIPAAFDWPDKLKYIRSNLLDILREYGITSAGIRMTESMAKSVSVERTYVKGVIQEAFASSCLKRFYLGQIATIASRLGVDRKAFKEMVSGENGLNVEGWNELSDKKREAVLTAIGAGAADV